MRATALLEGGQDDEGCGGGDFVALAASVELDEEVIGAGRCAAPLSGALCKAGHTLC